MLHRCLGKGGIGMDEELIDWLEELGYDTDNMTEEEMWDAVEDEQHERALDAAWDKYMYKMENRL